MNITVVSRNAVIRSKCEEIISQTVQEPVEIYKDVVSVKGKFRGKKEVYSDLYLIDAGTPRLDLDEITGIIRAMPGSPLMILIAEDQAYAVQGYEWGIFRYVEKEHWEEKLEQAVLAAADAIRERDEGTYCIKTHLRYLNIHYRDIKYIYKQGKNCIFVTTNGEYRIRKSMDNLEKEMNQPEFVKISRGVSVNLKQVESWHRDTVILRDGTKLSATRMQPDTFVHMD